MFKKVAVGSFFDLLLILPTSDVISLFIFGAQFGCRHHSAEYHDMLLSSKLAEPGNR